MKIAFSIKQRLFIIKVYYATKSYAKVKEKFRNEYPESGDILNSTIKHLIDKFKKMGWVQMQKRLIDKFKKMGWVQMLGVKKGKSSDKIMQLIEASPTISAFIQYHR